MEVSDGYGEGEGEVGVRRKKVKGGRVEWYRVKVKGCCCVFGGNVEDGEVIKKYGRVVDKVGLELGDSGR